MLFTALLYPMGVVIALLVLVVVASRASAEFTWTGALVNAAVLIAMCVGIFVCRYRAAIAALAGRS